MIFKRVDIIIVVVDIVDKLFDRQINKQNRERQNDFFQQFDVRDFQFSYQY